jgi:hypothetical protein
VRDHRHRERPLTVAFVAVPEDSLNRPPVFHQLGLVEFVEICFFVAGLRTGFVYLCHF